MPKVSGFKYLDYSDFAFFYINLYTFAVHQIIVILLQVRIFGGPDIYVREGSSLQLECVISQTIVSPKVSPPNILIFGKFPNSNIDVWPES